VKYSPLLALTLASLAGWATLLFARGKFWNAPVDAHVHAMVSGVTAWPRVEAIVPARNEAETIGVSIATLVAQQYAGDMRVTLVDDASNDGTAVLAQTAAFRVARCNRLTVVRSRALESPWTGKLNALETGVRHVLATRGAPAYWLFTDADIAHDAANVAALVAKARYGDFGLVSLMVRLRCESAWEALLVPAFVFFFQKLYPFAWANEPSRADAAAAAAAYCSRTRHSSASVASRVSPTGSSTIVRSRGKSKARAPARGLD